MAVTPRLLVCCDFDGTLSHLVEHPPDALPVPGAIAVLDALGRLPDTWVAVVSGRELSVLAQLAVPPPHVRLVGSHGAEFEPGVIDALGLDEQRLLTEVISRCADITADHPEALVETKPASVAVHVRNVPRDRVPGLLARIRSGPGSLSGVSLIEGKEVVELSVVRVGKGWAVDVLRLRYAPTATMFIGDDVTDEAAFAALSDGDLGVKVGPGDTRAGWRVGDPDEVVALLEDLLTRRLKATVAGSAAGFG